MNDELNIPLCQIKYNLHVQFCLYFPQKQVIQEINSRKNTYFALISMIHGLF